MNEIQDGRLNRGIGARLNVVEAGPASTLAPEVMPVYIVAPPSEEDSLLRGEYLCAAAGTTSEEALYHSFLQLRNPLDSATIIVVDDIILSTVVVDRVLEWGLRYDIIDPAAGPPDWGFVGASGVRDTRRAKTNAAIHTVARVATGRSVTSRFDVVGKRMGRMYSPKNEQIRLGYVITPGYCFIVENLDTGSGFQWSIRWRERRAQPSELAT